MSTGSGVADYYHPDNWLPHITIGFGDIDRDNLAEIVRFLIGRELNWEIKVSNVTYIANTGQTRITVAVRPDRLKAKGFRRLQPSNPD